MCLWEMLVDIGRGLCGAEPRVGSFTDKGKYIGGGVYVRMRSYGTSKYTEGDHVIEFGVADEPDYRGYVIYNTDLRAWLPPHDQEVISEQKARQIVANIRKACRSPVVDRGVRPYMPVPRQFPERWVVWTNPPKGRD